MEYYLTNNFKKIMDLSMIDKFTEFVFSQNSLINPDNLVEGTMYFVNTKYPLKIVTEYDDHEKCDFEYSNMHFGFFKHGNATHSVFTGVDIVKGVLLHPYGYNKYINENTKYYKLFDYNLYYATLIMNIKTNTHSGIPDIIASYLVDIDECCKPECCSRCLCMKSYYIRLNECIKHLMDCFIHNQKEKVVFYGNSSKSNNGISSLEDFTED